MPQLKKALLTTFVILILVGAGVFVREYLLLKRIESALRSPVKSDSQTTAAPKPIKLVHSFQVADDKSSATARVRFAAFKDMIEHNPQILAAWGRFNWRVIGDTPALCIKSLAPKSPLTEIGAEVGDCVTHLDGETVNQPMRNLAIWVGLHRRDHLSVILLRHGKRIRYELSRV